MLGRKGIESRRKYLKENPTFGDYDEDMEEMFTEYEQLLDMIDRKNEIIDAKEDMIMELNREIEELNDRIFDNSL